MILRPTILTNSSRRRRPVSSPRSMPPLTDFTLDVPERLERDPEVESVGEYPVPVTGELPELEDVTVGDTLVLGFPAAQGRLSQSVREFVGRFRDLSTLRQLDGDADSTPQR